MGLTFLWKKKTVIKLEKSHPCVKFLRGPLQASEGGEDKMASGRKKIMTFFCVVENVGGGVRSHPAVRKLLAVRHIEIELEM